MCMCVYVQDASGKGRLVVELESQLACLERQMSDEREVWRRAELTSERERVALQQALSESSQNQWRVEMESEAVSKRRSTVSLDLDLTREIDHLNKVRLWCFQGEGLCHCLQAAGLCRCLQRVGLCAHQFHIPVRN